MRSRICDCLCWILFINTQICSSLCTAQPYMVWCRVSWTWFPRLCPALTFSEGLGFPIW